MMGLLFANFLRWLLIAVGAWLGYQLVRQNGRILLRLESIEKHLRPKAELKRREPTGLPIGTIAPDFELPDLTGRRRKLSDFREQNVLLVFFNPQCGFCTQMAADLAALSIDGSDKRAVPIVVTTGDAEQNRKLVAQYGIRCFVLLQEQMEVASQFRAQGTPMGYRIDGAGRIASELAVGAEPLLQLATGAARHQNNSDAPANCTAPHHAKDNSSLARSRLNRSGLKAGTLAPDFQLPRLDGGELALADYRGRRVLLVFSDPDCGPCDDLAPWLQDLHEARPDLSILVISRRDTEATRGKARKLGLSFPIVMQKQWEISLKFAMFATPIGYLIDEHGIIVRDVAIGVQPILDLAEESASPSYAHSDAMLVDAH